jgi:FixJ family two-component response regulator
MSADAETVFLVDDDASVRKSLSRMLRAAGLQVEVFSCAEDYLTHEQPYEGIGCLLLDVQLPGLNGLDLQDRLSATGNLPPQAYDALPIVFLTGHGDIPMSVRGMKGGAVNFLTKPVDETVLLSAIEDAFRLHRQRRAERSRAECYRVRLGTLSEREFEVLRHVIAGQLNKQIAVHLGVVEKTIKVHRARVMQKLGVGSVAELVRLCDELEVKPASPLP